MVKVTKEDLLYLAQNLNAYKCGEDYEDYTLKAKTINQINKPKGTTGGTLLYTYTKYKDLQRKLFDIYDKCYAVDVGNQLAYVEENGREVGSINKVFVSDSKNEHLVISTFYIYYCE